jgi:hypothetical protein
MLTLRRIATGVDDKELAISAHPAAPRHDVLPAPPGPDPIPSPTTTRGGGDAAR